MRLATCLMCIFFLYSCTKIDGNDSVQHTLKVGKKCHHLYNSQVKLGIFETWVLDTVQSSYIYSPKVKDKIFTDTVVITLGPLSDSIKSLSYPELLNKNLKKGAQKFELLKQKSNMMEGVEYVVLDYQMMLKKIPIAGTCMFIKKRKELLTINCTGADLPKGAYELKREQFLSIMRTISWI